MNGTSYLFGNGIYSTKDASQFIEVFSIENNLLNDSVKLIKTDAGIVNSIDLYFDFFGVVQRPERPLKLIRYDSNKRIIYIPVIDKDGAVTDRYIPYRFTGAYFEHLKVRKE